jgi:hypothetical protein
MVIHAHVRFASLVVLVALSMSAALETRARPDEAVVPTTGALMGGTPTPTPTDHDLVVGHWGIQARQLAGTPYPLTLTPNGACPTPNATLTAPCTIDMGAIAVRYWKTRNLAWNAGLAFALGGGKLGSQGLDTYYGVGPIVGLTMLLGNWRHLAISANPEASYVYFKPTGGSGPSTQLVTFRAELEGELHFGFIDVPALSIGLTAGMLFRYESAPGASTWSVSVTDARSVWGTLTSLFIRYYL